MAGSSAAVLGGGDPAARAAARENRLEVLISLRKLYRNLLRAEGLLELPSPVYSPPTAAELAGESEEAARDEEAARVEAAVESVAEMELTAEQLKVVRRGVVPVVV